MKTYSIAEINDLDHGIPISRFEGRIKKVFDQKQGEGQYGIWYLQNLIVEDGQQEITVTWTGDDPFDTGVEGQVYSFETGYDKKEKPVGIVRDIRTKNGKKYEGVKVDNRSKIARLDKPNGSAFANARATMQQGDTGLVRMEPKGVPEGKTIKPESSVHDQQGEDGVTEARKHLMRCCNLYNLCIAAADKAIAPNMPEIARTSEQFQSTLASLWIEASSRRCTNGVDWWSYIDKMPDTPVNGGKHATTASSKPKHICTCENTDGDNPLCPIHST